MNVPKVVQSCHRKGRDVRRESGVASPDGLCHECRHAVGVDRHPFAWSEHMAGLGPGMTTVRPEEAAPASLMAGQE